jgi:hypothetical protein
MNEEQYIGAFQNILIDIDDDKIKKPFYNKEKCVLDLYEKISFPYENEEIEINIHMIGYLSIKTRDINKLFNLEITDYQNNSNREKIEYFAYLIFSSFFGLIDGCYFLNTDKEHRYPVDFFLYNQSENVFSQNGGSGRFTSALSLQYNYKDMPFPNIYSDIAFKLQGGGTQIKIDEFVKMFSDKIQEMRNNINKLDEVYYQLNTRFYKYMSIRFTEGVLVIGWTICEYLINRIFENGIDENLKKSRCNFFNNTTNKGKYPWAYDSSQRLRSYNKLLAKAGFDCSVKIKILQTELDCFKQEIETREEEGDNIIKKPLYEILDNLRNLRNKFVHDPNKHYKSIMLNHKSIFSNLNLSKRLLLQIHLEM